MKLEKTGWITKDTDGTCLLWLGPNKPELITDSESELSYWEDKDCEDEILMLDDLTIKPDEIKPVKVTIEVSNEDS